ncbi:MAG: cupin domain-containing protein [Acidobacteriales bacterium]|nr:cupin domain-containing protein [Terriglobales bacterium]
MFTMEHDNLGKGGPNRHMHPDQDEWLFAMEGEFQVEVGKNRMILKPGELPSESAVLSSYGIERVGPPLQL